MVYATPLLLMILTHVLADFVLQPAALIRARDDGKVLAYVIHGAILGVLAFAFLHWWYGLPLAGLFGLCLAVAHVAVDWVKDRVEPRVGVVGRFWILIGDQVVHLLLILLAWWSGPIQPEPRVIMFYAGLLGISETTKASFLTFIQALNHAVRAVTVFVGIIFGGAVLIRRGLDIQEALLDSADLALYRRQGPSGMLIGMLERALLMIMVSAHAWTGLGLVLAAKSMVRYKRFEEPGFAEYYIAGTLASTLLAVVGGLLIA